MRDILGWWRKFGVMGPSTNTIVQPDVDAMRPVGVTNHHSRIVTANADAASNESFPAGIEVIGANVLDAVRSVMTCAPGYLVMGMSAVTFFGGARGTDAVIRSVEEVSCLSIGADSHACTAALQDHGGVRRIAVWSPCWPVMNAEVARYFGDMGFSVVRDIACNASWTGIAEVPPSRRRDAPRSRTATTWMPSSRSASTCRWSGWPRRRSSSSASP
jgi:maleate isomerase